MVIHVNSQPLPFSGEDRVETVAGVRRVRGDEQPAAGESGQIGRYVQGYDTMDERDEAAEGLRRRRHGITDLRDDVGQQVSERHTRPGHLLRSGGLFRGTGDRGHHPEVHVETGHRS